MQGTDLYTQSVTKVKNASTGYRGTLLSMYRLYWFLNDSIYTNEAQFVGFTIATRIQVKTAARGGHTRADDGAEAVLRLCVQQDAAPGFFFPFWRPSDSNSCHFSTGSSSASSSSSDITGT